MLSNVKNVIFDLDNTLYNFSSLWLRANKEVFYYFGYDKVTDYNSFFELYKKHNDKAVEKIKEGQLRLRRLRQYRIIETLKELGIDATEEDSKNYYDKHFEFIESFIQPDEKLIAQLKELKKYYNLAILTNGKSQEQRRKIKKLGLENIFKVYISEETWFDKPEQAAFFNVLDDNKFLASETLMVGDSLVHDIEPARKLGFKTCLINRKWHFDVENKNDNYASCKVNDEHEIIQLLLNEKNKNV